MTRKLRSVLYVPGINEKAMKKAITLPVDAVVFDLEDSVLYEHKNQARTLLASFLQENRTHLHKTYVVIRVNGYDTEFWQDDLAMANKASPDAVLLPKVTQSAIIHSARAVLALQGSVMPKIWCMIENPMGILKLENIIEDGQSGDIECLVLGINDLIKDSDIESGEGRSNLMPWLAHIMLVAKSYGIPVIDGVLNDIHDTQTLKSESEAARAMGMSGKTIIHPAQIDVVNQSFSPTQEQRAWWKLIVDTYAQPQNAAKGVINLNGAMVERLHLEIAERKLREYSE